MNPTDHNVEDIIRGVRAIARALRATPAQVHALRARHGLPVFLSGKVLCARVAELDAWRAVAKHLIVAHPARTAGERAPGAATSYDKPCRIAATYGNP